MRNIKVGIWGFGAMGSGMAKMLLKKTGVEIVSVCDMHPDRVGKSIYEVLGTEKGERSDVIIKSDANEAFTDECADVVLLATDSFTKGAFDKIKLILEKKINVISTAEFLITSSLLVQYPTARPARYAAPIAVVSTQTGLFTGALMISACVCIKKSFAHAPPSTLSAASSIPESAFIAARTSLT